MAETLDRRALLRRAGLAGAASALAVGAPRPAAWADEELAPFHHGVASGDPLPDRVMLWTRVTPPAGHDGSPIPVTWVVATDVDLTDVVASGTATATADRDWTVKVDPSGLAPFTYHYYAFRALDAQSLTGRTKTAPAAGQAGVDRLRFGVVSCSNYEGGFFNAYARLADRADLDAILCLGDYVYEYGQGSYGPGEEIGRVTEPPLEMVTLEEYRGRYSHYRLDPDLRRLHQLFPWINTWDDHEVTDNSWEDGADNHNPDAPTNNPAEEGLDYLERKARAQRVWEEWLPTRVEDPSRIYRTIRYGDLADLIWMDTRMEGRDEIVGGVLDPENAVYPELDDPEREMISEAQRQAIYGDLSRSKDEGIAWRILCQQVMLMHWNASPVPSGLAGNDFPRFVMGDQGLVQGGYRANPDAWDGYSAERTRLFDHLLDNDIQDVVVLTGDIHSAWAADLSTDPFDPGTYDPTGQNPAVGRNVGVEFVGSSVTSDNFDEIVMSQGGTREQGIAASMAIETGSIAVNPHIKMVELRSHGFFVLDVTAERVQSDWFFVPILEASDEESFFDAWYVDRGAHRVVQASAPLAAREGAPEDPGTMPAPPASEPAPPAAPVLPATGGGAVVAGAAALTAAFAVRRRGTARRLPDPPAD